MLNYVDAGTVINVIFVLSLMESLCMEMYLPLIQSFEWLLIISGNGFRMDTFLNIFFVF